MVLICFIKSYEKYQKFLEIKTEKPLNDGLIYMNPVKWKQISHWIMASYIWTLSNGNRKKIHDINLQILTISWFHILKHEKGLNHIELRCNFSEIQKHALFSSLSQCSIYYISSLYIYLYSVFFFASDLFSHFWQSFAWRKNAKLIHHSKG